jgi:hypothetical protein
MNETSYVIRGGVRHDDGQKEYAFPVPVAPTVHEGVGDTPTYTIQQAVARMAVINASLDGYYVSA